MKPLLVDFTIANFTFRWCTCDSRSALNLILKAKNFSISSLITFRSRETWEKVFVLKTLKILCAHDTTCFPLLHAEKIRGGHHYVIEVSKVIWFYLQNAWRYEIFRATEIVRRKKENLIWGEFLCNQRSTYIPIDIMRTNEHARTCILFWAAAVQVFITNISIDLKSISRSQF